MIYLVKSIIFTLSGLCISGKTTSALNGYSQIIIWLCCDLRRKSSFHYPPFLGKVCHQTRLALQLSQSTVCPAAICTFKYSPMAIL